MAMMFGRFEIQSEISKSETALIYKAMDTETNQVVALKTQSLEPLGERSPAFVETLISEGERTRDLASQNIVLLYGAGEIEGQFCAAMEYIQGNSIATMLARKEGFSIWDLLDITRQVCAALESASALGVVHASFEPAKILVQWDGLVKVLGYGISNMSLIEAEAGNGLGRLMPYCSPEQIRGEEIDQRSNIFTLGAILYEMVACRRAFDATDPVALLGQIENEMPIEPVKVNPKIHPAVSALIMKALAKNPAERYPTARDLVVDLEACKEGGKKPAAEPKRAAAPAVKVDAAARAAAAAKFVSAAASAAEARKTPSAGAPARVPNPTVPSARPSAPRPTPQPEATSMRQAQPPVAAARAAAAGAGESSGNASLSAGAALTAFTSTDEPTSGARLIEELDNDWKASPNASPSAPSGSYSPVMSSAVVEEEPETQSPKVAGDPMMSAPAAPAQRGSSFSDLDELPPMKEPVYAPPPPPDPETQSSLVQFESKLNSKQDEKPRVQPREVAQKAINEIATIPPRLMLFSILGAVVVILIVALAVFFHVRSEDDGSTAAPRPVKPAAQAESTPQAAAPAPAAVAEKPLPPIADEQPDVTVRQIQNHNTKAKRAPAPAPAPVIIPGQAMVDSNPQGAQFQVDGKSDPSWVTPFDVTGLTPGKHVIAVSKSGYTTEVRSVDVASGSKSSVAFHLAPINALVVVNSTPAGAEILLDGKPTNRVTPAQFAVEKGSHTVLLKKQGFLDETTTADLGPGQNFQYAPALRALGDADAIRTVGKFKKLFGNGGDSTAGMGTVSIHTTPKGAQVAINQRILDKMSPVEVMMGPGNYVVDITLTGFKPIHKVISVEKAGKVAIDEIMERE